jgi:hypothetical protein
VNGEDHSHRHAPEPPRGARWRPCGSRREAVAAGPSAFSLAGEDAELFKLEAEIAVLNRAAQEIREQSIEPADAAWHALARTDWEAACAFGLSSGREEAVERIVAVDAKADRLFERLMAIPATTQAGRAAKVRGLLVHAWAAVGAAMHLISTGRKSRRDALLGEFAGMSAEELAVV